MTDHERDLADAEEVVAGLAWGDVAFMFDADTWYEAMAFLLAERAPA